MISSRTPEGDWNHCPVCQSEVCIAPSQPFGDATCPACGSLLWFMTFGGDGRLYDRDEGNRIEVRLKSLLAERFGISPHAVREGDWDALGIDSLDAAELMLELEEE